MIVALMPLAACLVVVAGMVVLVYLKHVTFALVLDGLGNLKIIFAKKSQLIRGALPPSRLSG